jgi:hypothetical protein
MVKLAVDTCSALNGVKQKESVSIAILSSGEQKWLLFILFAR